MDISMIGPDMLDMISFGPDILQLVQIEIQTRKVTYQEIAKKANIATGTVGSWFSRGAIPQDKLWSVVGAVGGAKLWMQVLARIPGNVFSCQYLDSVDIHPKPIIEDATEIAEIILYLSKKVQKTIRHREKGYMFSSEDEQTLLLFEDSVADSIIIGQMVLVRMEEHYDRSTHSIMARQAKRMRDQGYCSMQDKEKATCVGAQMTLRS